MDLQVEYISNLDDEQVANEIALCILRLITQYGGRIVVGGFVLPGLERLTETINLMPAKERKIVNSDITNLGLLDQECFFRSIRHEVCSQNDVTWEDVMSDSRKNDIVVARQELMGRLHEEMGMAYSEIGRRMNRDHSTVMHGVQASARRKELYCD